MMLHNLLMLARANGTNLKETVNALPQVDATNDSVLTVVLNIVFGTVGAVALLIIVIAGQQYITSAGDPQKAAGAKKAIVYALVGLLVVLGAYSIVTLVTKKVAL